MGMTSDHGCTAVLEVRNLSYAFGAKMALDAVNLRLDDGQFKVLLGPNGAGKTTLFSLVTRLYESRDGSIAVAGRDLRRHPGQALSRMGVVFQQPTLDLDLTVRQNLLYHASLHGLDRRSALRRMEIELGRLDMAERTGETVRKLNGGHRRRVEIARALLHQPTLLLLDEPTVGLDVPSRRAIVAHAHRLAREDRVAVLWATHLIDEVEETDAVVVLHRGRVKADGGLTEVLTAAGAATIGEAFDRLTAMETP
jgi:ABC-2 type transport system ATP-binding protein